MEKKEDRCGCRLGVRIFLYVTGTLRRTAGARRRISLNLISAAVAPRCRPRDVIEIGVVSIVLYQPLHPAVCRRLYTYRVGPAAVSQTVITRPNGRPPVSPILFVIRRSASFQSSVCNRSDTKNANNIRVLSCL